MIDKPDNVTVVVLSETEAKEISVRYSLRCICRDCWYLVKALARHCNRYYRVYTRGLFYKNHWWMQIKH